MKKMLLGFILGIMGTVNAQDLSIVSTSPVNGAVGVDQDSISITFNKKIKLDESMFQDGVPIPFLFLPFDSVEINQIRLSNDSLSMIIDASFADSTDFIFVILDAEATDETRLPSPEIIRFTTRAQAGDFVINGTVEMEEMEMLKNSSLLETDNGLAVFLTQEGLDLGIDFDDEEDSEGGDTEEEEDDFFPLNLAFVNTETGEYSIPGVREGDYLAFGFDIYTIEQDDEEFFPEIFIHDLNEDFALDTIKVNSTDAPTDTLNGIDLRLLEFEPVTFQSAIEKTVALGFGSDVSLLGGQTEIPLYFEDLQDGPEKIRLKGLPFKTKDMEGPVNPFFDHTQGKSIIWSSFFYNSTDDELYFVGISPFGAQVVDTMDAMEAEIPVPFNTLNPLPETYIDSDSAAFIAENNGGMEFLQKYGDADFSAVEFLAAHEYWAYPLDNTSSAPTFWKVSYRAESYDFPLKSNNMDEGGYYYGFQSDSLIFYIDIVSGEILYKAGNNVTDGPSFNVISSAPLDGDFGVPGMMDIAITFDAPLRIDPYDPFGDGTEIIPFPLDSIEVTDIRLADQGRTLVYTVQHTPDTDFTWVVSRATNTGGGILERPYVFNYTTAASNASSTVAGEITPYAGNPLKAVNQHDGIMVALFTTNPFASDFENDSDEGDGADNDDGPNLQIARAALADTLTGTYTIEGVRDGEYYPIAINLIRDSFSGEPVALGIYDPEDDGTLNSITVAGGSVADVDIEFKPFVPITAGQAVTMANATAAALDSELDLYFFFGEEDMNQDDEFDDCKEDCEEEPKRVFKRFKTEEAFTPAGTSEAWGLLYVNTTSETAILMGATPFGVSFMDTVDVEEFLIDLELPEETTVDDLTPLPSEFFDSDLASGVAEQNGGSDFRQGDDHYVEIEYIAIDAPFLLPEDITHDGSAWAVIYSKDDYSEFGPVYSELVVFIDFVTGTFLGTAEFEDEGYKGTALEGLGSAYSLAISEHSDNELYIINAQTLLQRDPVLDTLKFKNAAVAPSDIDSAGLAGRFSYIDYRFYSTLAEQETALFVAQDGIANYHQNPFNYLPDGIGFADLEPIPESIIDSDSAITVAENEGGQTFRNNLKSNFDLVRLELSVQAGNRYWEYPDGVDSEKVSWNVIYNRISREKTTGEYEFENATYFIDIETGELLAQQVNVSNENDLGNDLPSETTLGQNYPNPFNPNTTIPFTLKSSANVELTIYNMLGQRVATLINNQRLTAGNHVANWDASAMASGMYIYRITAGDFVKTKKLTLIK